MATMASGMDARRAVPDAMERLPTLLVALDAFLQDKARASRSFNAGTVRNLRSQLRDLLDDERPVLAFDVSLCRELMDRPGLMLSSLRTRWGALSTFGSWLVLQGWIAENPMRRIPKPNPAPRRHRYLSRDELDRLWKACARCRPPDEMRLILRLLMEGLRANELCQLRWQDVREDRLVVAFGKGGRHRVVPLRPATKALLDARRVNNIDFRESTRSGLRIFSFKVAALENRLHRLGEWAKVPGVHPHLLRHTFASLNLLAGMDKATLSTLGGWSENSSSMRVYIDSVREEAAIQRALAHDLGVFD